MTNTSNTRQATTTTTKQIMLHSIPTTDSLNPTTTRTTTTATTSRQQRSQLRSSWGSNTPLVRAMLEGNSLRNCADVRDVLAECIESRSDDRICTTAALYFEQCMHYPGGSGE
mmetsp:Transcript_20849/g.45199  ORF Transcript_20849/g.45199 Transcript_20849/m.45199 type:complete len:113 (-) Transcript_20849:225-563(-)